MFFFTKHWTPRCCKFPASPFPVSWNLTTCHPLIQTSSVPAARHDAASMLSITPRGHVQNKDFLSANPWEHNPYIILLHHLEIALRIRCILFVPVTIIKRLFFTVLLNGVVLYTHHMLNMQFSFWSLINKRSERSLDHNRIIWFTLKAFCFNRNLFLDPNCYYFF